MTDILEKTRAVLLVVLMLGSVVALSTPVVATNASTTTVDDPGGDAPVPGDTQDVLNLTVNSGDTVKTGSASAGADTRSFVSGAPENTDPEMFVDDGTNAGTYENGDDILKISRGRDGSTSQALDGKTLNHFSDSVKFADPSGTAYDGDEPVISSSDSVINSGEIVSSGTAGILTGLSSSNYQHWDDPSAGSSGAYDASESSYGEPIYDSESSNRGQVEGSDTRVTSVSIKSASSADNDISTIDLPYTLKALVSSEQQDASNNIATSTFPEDDSTSLGEINGGTSGTGAIGSDDVLILDTDNNNQYDSSRDIVLYDGGASLNDGDAFDTNSVAGRWEYTSNLDGAGTRAVVFDVGNDDADQRANELIIQGGSASVGPVKNYSTNSGQPAFFDDSQGNVTTGSYEPTTDSIYIDIDSNGVDAGDARLSHFRIKFDAGTSVSTGDVDDGLLSDIDSFASDEYYLDADSSGTLDDNNAVSDAEDEAIIKNTGTDGTQLETDDTVVVSGSGAFTALRAKRPGSSEGSSGILFVDDGTDPVSPSSGNYEDGDDILFVTKETSGSVALSGATLHNFASSSIGYTDTVTDNTAYDDGEAIYSEGDTGAVGGDDFGDDVTAITVVNNGTLSNDHIDEVTLYQNGSQIASTTSTTSNGSWVFSGLGADVHSGAHSDFLLRATIASDAPADETLNFSVVPASDDGDNTFQSGDSGLFFQQAAVTGDYSNGADITVDSPSAISVDGISFNDSSDNNRTKVELAFSRSINDTTATPGHFTVYREDGQTVSISDVETGASADDGQLGIDLGSANSARIHTVNISTNSVSTTEGANISAQNVSVTATTKTITEGTAVSTNTAYQDEYVAIYADSNGNLDENITIDSDTTGDGTYDTSVFGGSTGTGSQIYAFDTQSQNPDHDFRTTFQSADGDSDETATLGLQRLGLNASAQNTAIADDGDLQLDVSTNLSDRDLKGELVAENGETVTTQTVTLDDSGEGTLNFGTREAGNYTVEVTDVQTGSSVTSNEITVTTPQAAFSANTVTVDSGDSGKISINLQSADTATVTVGSKATGYLANVTVKDGDGDSAIRLEWDTHLAGETSGVSDDFSVADSDDEITQTEIDSAAQPDDSVDTGTYDLAVRTGTDPSVKSQSSAAIVVEGRSGGGSSTGTELTAETSTKDPNTTPAQDRTGGLTGAQTGRSSGGPTSEPIENRTATPTTTEAPATIEQPADDATSTEQETPGFGVIVAVLALLAVVRLAGRRHS